MLHLQIWIIAKKFCIQLNETFDDFLFVNFTITTFLIRHHFVIIYGLLRSITYIIVFASSNIFIIYIFTYNNRMQ